VALSLPKSREYFKGLRRHLPSGNHRHFYKSGIRQQVPFVRGEGSRLWDLDGNEHLDLFSHYGASFVGHGNRKYNERLKQQIDRVLCVDQAGIEASVCERLTAHIPSADWIRFGLSGTEIVQNAIRLVRAFTGKTRILRFVGHYHGSADNILGGMASSPQDPRIIDHPDADHFTEGRAPGTLEQNLIIPWNDAAILEQTLKEHSDSIAGLIMEPVAINGGGVLPKPGYLESVRQLCDKYGVVFIMDEVITGFRTALGGAQSIYGVTPDLTILGKALSGGAVPVSAMAGRKELLKPFDRQVAVHAGTFNGYAMGLAGIEATMDLVESDPGCYQRMGSIMIEIGKVIASAAKAHGLPCVVQGVPTGLSVHFRQNPLTDTAEFTTEQKVKDGLVKGVCENYGLQYAPGFFRLYSNLLLSEDDIEFTRTRIYDAFAEAKTMLDSLQEAQVD